MKKTLLLYSTTDGHTVEICRRLQQVIEQHDHQVRLLPIADAGAEILDKFDQIVIGASIRYGRHKPQVAEFIKRHQAVLERKQNAFFSVSVVARKLEKNQPDTNPYLKKFLQKITWNPQRLAVFAGKIDYPNCRWFDRAMIRLIMWMTKGPTAPDSVVVFTDWQAVEAFGRLLCD